MAVAAAGEVKSAKTTRLLSGQEWLESLRKRRIVNIRKASQPDDHRRESPEHLSSASRSADAFGQAFLTVPALNPPAPSAPSVTVKGRLGGPATVARVREIVMLDLEYRHVDVFSRRALRGNGLMVVLNAASMPAAVMQDLTREVRQFETAFLTEVDLAAGYARLRIFTEDEELDFAGHPVLGAAAVLHTLLPVADEEQTWALTVAQRTIEVRTRGAAGWIDATMDQGVPHFGPAIPGGQARAYSDALNLAPGQLHPALPMQVVSTGLPYLIVPVQGGLERARISHLRFDELLAASGAKFVYVLDPDRPEGRTWDNAGRIEDVATGSAAGPAAGYLLRHGVRHHGEPLLIHQGRFTGRPSTIEVRPEPDGRLLVGGPVAPVASGRFHAHLT
jgi:PhzF family phenazine biosynthesis protein